MKKSIIFGVLVLILLVNGCYQQEQITGNLVKETVTKYVCPDGSTVNNKEDCQLKENVVGVGEPKISEETKKTTEENKCAYVGSKNSDKYHYASCQWAKKIKPENLVCFKNIEEAKAKGYSACKVCHPPS